MHPDDTKSYISYQPLRQNNSHKYKKREKSILKFLNSFWNILALATSVILKLSTAAQRDDNWLQKFSFKAQSRHRGFSFVSKLPRWYVDILADCWLCDIIYSKQLSAKPSTIWSLFNICKWICCCNTLLLQLFWSAVCRCVHTRHTILSDPVL